MAWALKLAVVVGDGDRAKAIPATDYGSIVLYCITGTEAPLSNLHTESNTPHGIVLGN